MIAEKHLINRYKIPHVIYIITESRYNPNWRIFDSLSCIPMGSDRDYQDF